MNQLLFRYDLDGHIYSVMGREMVYPVLDFAGMKPENNFETNYNLEKMRRDEQVPVIGTKKVPLRIKNAHREVWGMPPVKTNRGDRHLLELLPKKWVEVITLKDERRLLKAAGFDPQFWCLLVSRNEEHVRYWVRGVEKKFKLGYGLYAIRKGNEVYHEVDAMKRLVKPRRKKA